GYIPTLHGLGGHSSMEATYPSRALIPTAIDPCLGVSTFLSCYIRLLIREARRTEAIWNHLEGCQLLLNQMCEHLWGVELDGFAFWIARCGILAALAPLTRRVQTLLDHSNAPSHLGQGPIIPGAQQRPFRSSVRLPRLHLFRNDTLQLTVPEGNTPDIVWERECLVRLRNPTRLRFDFIVTNPPYMIRKTGTFSAPDPEVYDWRILGASSLSGGGKVAAPTGTKGKVGRGSR
ncbi:hypothetical protein BGW38_007077, partial [Lunasporangiospora selenospora]